MTITATVVVEPTPASGGWRFVPPSPLTVTVASPAAGAQWTWTPPAGNLVVVESVAATFTTDATAGTRSAAIALYGPSTTLLATLPLGADQPASKVVTATWAKGLSLATGPAEVLTSPLPLLVLPAGGHVSSLVAGIKAGDAWTAIALSYRLI